MRQTLCFTFAGIRKVFSMQPYPSIQIGCIYHFYEASMEHLENFKYFLKYGIQEDVYYVVLLASNTNLKLPKLNNVEFHQIANEYRDIGGYIKGHKIISKVAEWDFLFFMNSGVLGPLPNEKLVLGDRKWTTHFTNLIDGDVKVAGVTINTLPRPIPWSAHLEKQIRNSTYSKYMSKNLLAHVQSFFICLGMESRHLLEDMGFFEQELLDDQSFLIANFEIALSQIILSGNDNWTIACSLSGYSDLNFKTLRHNPNTSSPSGDPYLRGAYFGKTIDPIEAMFFKTTRGLLSSQELKALRNRAHPEKINHLDLN